MIVYNQAYDLYHCVFRILHLLNKFDQGDSIEVDRVRIWDFYLLFPEKIHEIRLKQNEQDVRRIRSEYVKKKNNPYDEVNENRKIFERIKPYQTSALSCIASYGIISKENLLLDRVTITSKKTLNDYMSNVGDIPSTQRNVIALLTSHFYQMSLFGVDGLKSRTNLIESKYDA